MKPIILKINGARELYSLSISPVLLLSGFFRVATTMMAIANAITATAPTMIPANASVSSTSLSIE
jgi:hypothetical protein